MFISNQLELLTDPAGNMTFQKAQENYQKGMFTNNSEGHVSFGFTRDVIWASVIIENTSGSTLKKRLYFDTAWLDRVDLHFIRHGESTYSTAIGDSLKFASRNVATRMPVSSYDFPPGTTQVLMRFQSKDPMLMPIYLFSEEQMQQKVNGWNYFYGFLYGAFSILLVYNIALSLSLKDKRYIFYTLYLLSFLSLNIAYTGHGFKYLWPENLYIQKWAMIFFLYCYILFGIAFCIEFLKLKTFLPNFYKMKNGIYTSLVVTAVSLFIYSDQLLAVKVAVALTSLLVIFFVFFGVLAYRKGHDMVKFFIPASLLGAGGAAISAGTTWGVIPYNTYLFHSIEIGMLFEMFILALALAFTLKEMNEARNVAEINAQFDYLTQLYNRRAFASAVDSQWHYTARHEKNCAVILADIDWFKNINDKYGHAAGDKVLKDIALILKLKIRKSDIVARWGGEEFIIFLPNTDKMSAINIAAGIREKIQDSVYQYEDNLLQISASFGVAEYDKSMTRLEDLIKEADIALYKAKDRGRNTVCDVNGPVESNI